MEWFSWDQGEGLVMIDDQQRVRSYIGDGEWVPADALLGDILVGSLDFDEVPEAEAARIRAEIDARLARAAADVTIIEWFSWDEGRGLVSIDDQQRVRSYRGAGEWVFADHLLEEIRLGSFSFDRVTEAEADVIRAEIDARVAEWRADEEGRS